MRFHYRDANDEIGFKDVGADAQLGEDPAVGNRDGFGRSGIKIEYFYVSLFGYFGDTGGFEGLCGSVAENGTFTDADVGLVLLEKVNGGGNDLGIGGNAGERFDGASGVWFQEDVFPGDGRDFGIRQGFEGAGIGVDIGGYDDRRILRHDEPLRQETSDDNFTIIK